MIRYLTGAHNAGTEAVAFERGIGLMIQPGNSYHLKVDRYPFWAADNGAFTRSAKGFDADKFRRMLARPELRDAAGSCLFVVAPDKLFVHPDGRVFGDCEGTLEQFPKWAIEIRGAGFPVALVAQNGLETCLDRVQWDLVDTLFIGGSTEWKLSDAARVCAAEARRRGKTVHMGRVNSFKRMSRAAEVLCDTADGTFIMFGPKENLPRLLNWLTMLNVGVQAHLPWRNH